MQRCPLHSREETSRLRDQLRNDEQSIQENEEDATREIQHLNIQIHKAATLAAEPGPMGPRGLPGLP
jgi:hypothetical protein